MCETLTQGTRPVSTSCKVRCGNVDNWNLANCALFVFRTSCERTWPLLDFHLRRARSASRSKPEAKAVGGSRRSADPVDESEIDSANETTALGSSFRIWTAFGDTGPGQDALHQVSKQPSV